MTTNAKWPVELRVGPGDRVGEVALVVALDQMGDDLGVGLRAERVALVDQRVLELAEVLHDPVEHDRDLVLHAPGQRMRVLEGDLAVRGPARVPDPGRGRRAVQTGRGLQLVEVPDGPDVVEPLVLEQRDAGRVVPAVLEALEPVKEERVRLPGAHVSDDAAHLDPPFFERSIRPPPGFSAPLGAPVS